MSSHSTTHTTGNEFELDRAGRLDPTSTTSYQRDLARFIRNQIAQLNAEVRRKVQDEDAFGINSRGEWSGLSQAEQLRRFDGWLDDQIERLVLNPILRSDRVGRDFRRAAERGLKDARASVRKAARQPIEDGGLSQDEMQALERSLPDPEQRLEDREVRDGIEADREDLRQRVKSHTDDFAGEARQLVSAGLAAGAGASVLASDITERGQVAKSRGTAAAAGEIVNTFNTRKVRDYWDEVEADLEIEVEAEHVDAGDADVCETCLDISSMDWTFEDAVDGTPPRQPSPDDSFQYDSGPPWHDHCRCTYEITQIGEVF